MFMASWRAAIAAAALMLWAGGPVAAAGRTTAIVEDVSGVAGVELFDTLGPGEVVDLGRAGKLTLGYLETCEREVIEGGRVTIGEARSEVVGGKLRRGPAACQTGLGSGGSGAGQGAAIVYRGARPPGAPTLTIKDPRPVFLVEEGEGSLEIDRNDGTGTIQSLPLRGGAVEVFEPLQPGTYRARIGDRSVAFRIEPGQARSVLERLVRL